MAGYVWRETASRRCKHVGSVWNPPNTEVDTVACPYCGAAPKRPCSDRGRRVQPHASRYLAHHEEHCKTGPDWSSENRTPPGNPDSHEWLGMER